MIMRITAIHDIVVPIRSAIANAYIDFSQMTASVVAIVTDVGARRQAGRRLRLQFERPLRAAGPAARALHPAAASEAKPEEHRRRCRGLHRPGQAPGRR